MNSSKLADYSEILSPMAILVTLIFFIVGMQQNTDAIYTQSLQATVSNSLQEIRLGLDFPEIFSSIYNEGTLTS